MKGKFLSPNMMPGMGGFGGSRSMKLGKKVIGTMIKLQIAMYALKFGVGAAKAYFSYKLGRNLEDAIIEKFIGRYHRQRTRHFHRQYGHRSSTKEKEPAINITLGEECSRICVAGEEKACLFTFRIHLYQSLSRACYKCPQVLEDCSRKECLFVSGRRKLMAVVNKQLPGPIIQVCENDRVLVEVHNEMPNEQVTLHFRGQKYPDAPFMDGTPGLTQCPISPSDIFIYSFKATVPGTSFWHAQTGLLRSDGIYGPFIVKELAEERIYQNLYDIDMTKDSVLISEDFEKRGDSQFLNLYENGGRIDVHSLLINGRGKKLGPQDDDVRSLVLYSRFLLETGRRHRMRIISAVSSNCPFTLSLLGQSVSIIAIDGSAVQPKAATSILLSPGERFDIVIESLSRGLYWLEIKGFQDCSELRQYAVVESNYGVAINEAKRKNEMNSTILPTNFQLPMENPQLVGSHVENNMDVINCNNSNIHCSQNVTSNLNLHSRLRAPANLTLYLSLTNRKIHNEHFYSLLYYDIKSLPDEDQVFTPQINNITLTLPPTPLLFNEKPLKKGFCSTIAVRRQHCVDNYCECIHLQELPTNFVVDIVIINEGDANQEPQTMYFHGQKFYVLAQVKEPNITVEVEEDDPNLKNSTENARKPSSVVKTQLIDRMTVAIKDSEEPLPRNLVNPILKDCITVPSSGYSIIRMETDNPGFWLFESSSVFKSSAGMGLVFRIGKRDNFKQPLEKKKKC